MSLQPPQSQFPVRAFQWDLARQVERLDFLLKLLPRYAEWGYQELYLHLEDAVEYPSLPAVARPGAYTCAQFTRLVQAATAAGGWLTSKPATTGLWSLLTTAGREV